MVEGAPHETVGRVRSAWRAGALPASLILVSVGLVCQGRACPGSHQLGPGALAHTSLLMVSREGLPVKQALGVQALSFRPHDHRSLPEGCGLASWAPQPVPRHGEWPGPAPTPLTADLCPLCHSAVSRRKKPEAGGPEAEPCPGPMWSSGDAGLGAQQA